MFIREKKKLQKDLVDENLEREKRKIEWKKLNVMAKDKIMEERVKLQRES